MNEPLISFAGRDGTSPRRAFIDPARGFAKLKAALLGSAQSRRLAQAQERLPGLEAPAAPRGLSA